MARSFMLLLAACYLLAPLQDSLKVAVHDISHAISTVKTERHTHEHLSQSKMGRRVLMHHSHSHQNEVLSFFDALFNTNSTNDHAPQTATYKVDKQLAEATYPEFTKPLEIQKHVFYYNSSYYHSDRAVSAPPPKHTA